MPWNPDYITVADLKDYLRVEAGDVLDDLQLQVWCTAASRAINGHCNRQFGQLAAPAARVYRRPAVHDPNTGLWMLAIDDVQDLTGLTVGGVAYAAQAGVLLPDNAPGDGEPWTHLGFADCPAPWCGYGARPTVTVVARWGWAAVPAQVVGAAKLQANRWNARRRSPLGVAGSPEQGSELRLLARLDPDVATVLGDLPRARRPG